MARLRFLPRDERFFELFDQAATYAVAGAETLQKLLADTANRQQYRTAMSNIEHAADKVNHEAIDKLNKAFITPLDSEDIRTIANRLDDIIDSTQAAVERIVLYDITIAHPAAVELAAVFMQVVKEVQVMVGKIRDLQHREAILTLCIEINRLENDGDSIYREALGSLFRDGDLREWFRWKEIIERIEHAIDQCEDLADSIELTVAKHS